MKVKVLGIQALDYVSRRTGNPVKGVMLHSAFKDPQVRGEAVDGIFISDNLGISLANIQPGDTVEVETNFRGNVTNVIVCK